MRVDVQYGLIASVLAVARASGSAQDILQVRQTRKFLSPPARAAKIWFGTSSAESENLLRAAGAARKSENCP